MKTPIIAVVTLLLTTTACAATRIDESAKASPKGQIEVSNISGSVDVTGWDENEVSVTGTLGKGADRLEFLPSGNRTVIKVIVPRNARNVKGTTLKIRVPKGSRLNITTVSADIGVSDITGAQRLQAVSGDMNVQVFGEDVEAQTVSGDMTILGQETPAELTLSAVSGDLNVQRVSGQLAISTVSGDMNVAATGLGRVKANSTNGDIELESSLNTNAKVSIETINGDVNVKLRGRSDGDYSIDTFNGDIRNCFGPKAERSSAHAPGRELRFKKGTAAARIRIKTLNGDISVCDD